MENKKRYHDDQEPSSSKTPKLNRLDDSVPKEPPESSLYSNDEPQQANNSKFCQSIPRSESLPKQRIKKVSISSDDAAVLNKKNNAEIMPKRQLLDSDADDPPAKREKASDNGTTDKGHGLKSTLHGVTYQLKLLILILLQAATEIKNNKEFKCFITTEDPECGTFDDIVFRFEHGDQWYLLCIQAKHKEDDTKSIKWNDLLSTAKDNPYSISKYFNSSVTFRNPQQKTDGTEDSQPPTLVLCTNIGLEQEVKDLMVDEKHSFDVSLVSSFFNSLNSESYKFDLDKISEKNDGKLLDFLAENSDFKELPKQLAGCIFESKLVDFRNPLFKINRGFIQNKIATKDFMSKKTKTIYKVNEVFFNEPDTQEFKKSFETEYQKLTESSTKQNPSDKDIWRDIKRKGIKIHKEAITNEAILPKKIEQSQIENFFKSFIIASNTCNESELSGLIVNELKISNYLPADTQETIASEIARDHLSQWILEWMKDKGSKPLREEDIHEFFKCFAVRLRYLQFEGMSNEYCGKIQNMKLKCKTETLQQRSLYKKLNRWVSGLGNKANNDCKVDIFKSNDPSWVVYNTLELIKSNLNYLFLKDSQFKNSQKDIMKVFLDMTFPLILVIDCKSMSNVEGYIEGQVDTKCTKTFKKIILIDQNYSASETESEDEGERSEDLLFRDLTEESKETVFYQAEFINFFGTEISTSELIHDEDKLDFVLDVRQLTTGTAIKCNKLKESYEKIKEIFIHRKCEQCDKEKLPQTSSRSLWSGREEGTTLTKLFPGSAGDNKISFKTFLDYNDLNIEDFNNILLDRNSEYTSALGIDENTKVHVIFNEAGSGKSFYLTWLASNLQDVRPSWWIIKFNLNEYSMEFDQLQKNDESETMDELIAIRFLFQLVYLAFHVENRLLVVSNEKSSNAQTISETLVFSNGCLKLDENKMKTLSSDELVLLRMFEHKFNSKQIVILMDGFDEIAPYYKTVVLKLLSMLNTFDGICKVYLSSRPYGLRNEIETILKRCACYRLVKFNRKDQYEFIHRYLLQHLDVYKSSDETKKARTCSVVFAILSKMLKDLMEIPLFLSMGVELFMPMVKNYINLEEETVLKQIIKGCENSFETLSMVENFVAKKLIVNIEKTGATDAIAKTAEALNYAKQKLEKVKETHSLLALYSIMGEDNIKKLLSNDQQNAALRFMENVKNGSEKSGLIEEVARNRPIFNHMLFAEYFAAFWFYSNQNATGVKEFLKRKVYESGYGIEIRNFLDRMICKNSPLHMAVLDGSKLKMENILSKEPHSINARDEWGRIPLQLAFSSHFYRSWNEDGQDIVEFLLDRVDEVNVNSKETYFERYTLDYAYCAEIPNTGLLRNLKLKKWLHVLTLLSKGASIDTPEMLSRVSERKHFINLLLIESCSGRKCTTNFETFYTKVVQVSGPTKVLNLVVSRHDLFDMNMEAKRALFELDGDSIPILEFFIKIDSLMFKILMENLNDPKLEHANEHHLKLAFRFRSINVLQYLIVDRQQYLDLSAKKDNFEQELCVLLVYMQCDEQKFKSLFHDYCSRYKIDCLEETSLDKSKNWNRGISSQTKHFPTEFEIRYDPGIDSGTEFLISRALQLENESAVEYLLNKTKTNLDNRFIRQICRYCKIKWRCLSSYHFLLDDSKRSSSTDLKSTDENGRNLLHFAVGHGDLNLVKCLINHYGFKPSEMNEKEQNWNAFFYCVQGSGNASNELKIFTYLMKTDPFDCFGQLDSRERSVFYYATINEKTIGKEIFKRECKLQEHLPTEEQIPVLMGKLQKSCISFEYIWEYLEVNRLMNEKSEKIICDYLQTTGELNNKDEETGRNLLHIACLEGWLSLTKCLIEHYGFDAKEINEKDNNWNAFFYCVIGCGNFSDKLKIFTYLMEKVRFDCFGQLDLKDRSVFYYATINNKEIGKEIFKRECKLQEHLPIEERIPVLMGKLQKSGISIERIWKYLEANHLMNEESVKIICDYLKTTGELNYRNQKTGRNLLHIACLEGWLSLTKCLIEHYSFDAKEINEKHNNWNAFFYCVLHRSFLDADYDDHYDDDNDDASNKLKIFTYLMEKDPFDCFGQLDSRERSVFYYANTEIGNEIFKREYKLQEHLPLKERIPILMKRLQNSIFDSYNKILIFHENDLIDEESVKIICDYLQTTGELNYRNQKMGKNLLHIACMEGWLTLPKCLIEHYGFDAKEINEKHNNWNAFFYCVQGSRNDSNKLEIFTYLMEKYPFNCFDQLDSRGYNVFYYALFKNVLVAEYIILTDLPTNDSVSVKEWASTFSNRLRESKLTGEEIDDCLTDWKQQSSLKVKDEIYLEIRSNLKRINRLTE